MIMGNVKKIVDLCDDFSLHIYILAIHDNMQHHIPKTHC